MSAAPKGTILANFPTPRPWVESRAPAGDSASPPPDAAAIFLAEQGLPKDTCVALPDHLEDIVTGSHPSLGEAGRLLLRELLYRYEHVFPAPGEPVTGRTTSVQHGILTSDARPVRCGPRQLAPAGSGRPTNGTDTCSGNFVGGGGADIDQ